MLSYNLKIFLIISLLTISSAFNPCDHKPTGPYVDSAMFLNQSCYFTVINATSSSTTIEWGFIRFESVFNMTTARRMCALHDATLPIINSHAENEFVAKYNADEFVDEYGEKIVYRVALGMKRQQFGDFEWDDGTEVTYEPMEWEKKKIEKINSADCTSLQREWDEPYWHSFPCHGMGLSRLGVICKKVVNPDCQYNTRSSNTCLWDNEDKRCYDEMTVQILAPELKGGSPCPKTIRKECQCKETIAQRDEARSENAWETAVIDDKKHSANNGAMKYTVQIIVLFTVSVSSIWANSHF